MFEKLLGLATLPIDMAKDVLTLGGSITDEKSAVIEKLDYIIGKEKFNREQDRKDAELLIELLKEMNKK